MIYTGYFAQMRKFPNNVIPVAICGGLPSWYNGEWYRKPAPKWGFFNEWKQNGDNEFYIEHYQKEVLDELNVDRVLADFQLLVPEEWRAEAQCPIWHDPDHHLILLCYEKSTDFCHRHLFAAWLREKAGLEVEEWKC
jgi:hypothetical protein